MSEGGVLNQLEKNGIMSAKELSKKLNISIIAVRYNLKRLLSEGEIDKIIISNRRFNWRIKENGTNCEG